MDTFFYPPSLLRNAGVTEHRLAGPQRMHSVRLPTLSYGGTAFGYNIELYQ